MLSAELAKGQEAESVSLPSPERRGETPAADQPRAHWTVNCKAAERAPQCGITSFAMYADAEIPMAQKIKALYAGGRMSRQPPNNFFPLPWGEGVTTCCDG